MIDFELTEEQQMIRDTVGAFAIEQMRPAAREADETGNAPADLIEKLWELGVVVQSAIPEKFGGAGDTRSAVTGAVIAEEARLWRCRNRGPCPGARGCSRFPFWKRAPRSSASAIYKEIRRAQIPSPRPPP